MSKILMPLVVTLGLLPTPTMADVILSTSAINAQEGNILDLQLGQAGSMFLWMSTEPGQIIVGVGVDILSSDAAVLEGSSYDISTTNADATLRWSLVNPGTLDDLVTGSNASAFPPLAGTGLMTSGPTDFVLFSEIQFTATGEGMTALSLQANSNAFGDATGADLSSQLVGVTGTVNVSAVPEPSSGALLALVGGLACWHRRRRS